MGDYEYEQLTCPLCGFTVYQRDDRPARSCLATPVCRAYQPTLVTDLEARIHNPNKHGRK
jgi:hypothetical protein